MKRILSLVLMLSALPLATAHAQEAKKPNVVIMMVDNLGWGELGCYGGGELRGAPTPRLDKLASEGFRLLNFNVEPQCTPCRSAFMTGRHLTEAMGTPGVAWMVGDRWVVVYRKWISFDDRGKLHYRVYVRSLDKWYPEEKLDDYYYTSGSVSVASDDQRTSFVMAR